MFVVELLHELVIDSGLHVQLAQLVEEDGPRIVGYPLELVLLDDVLLVQHEQQVVVQVQQMLGPDVVQEGALYLQGLDHLRVVAVELQNS